MFAFDDIGSHWRMPTRVSAASNGPAQRTISRQITDDSHHLVTSDG
jgi:hypothetical protein